MLACCFAVIFVNQGLLELLDWIMMIYVHYEVVLLLINIYYNTNC